MSLVPHRFLFRYSFPVSRIGTVPKSLLLPKKYQLPDLAPIDEMESFAELRIGWKRECLLLNVLVERSGTEFHFDPSDVRKRDGVRVWLDTRNTQSIHRANRFCQQLQITAVEASGSKLAPLVRSIPISRAKEEPAAMDVGKIEAKAETTKSGYRMLIRVPAECLSGFDPDVSSKLGFCYHVQDSSAGEQHLTVGNEFPFESDPSLWSTLDLIED